MATSRSIGVSERAAAGARPDGVARSDGVDGVVFGIKRASAEDGPGIRTTVFLKGCPLRCAWCHNPEGLDPVPSLTFTASRCVACGLCVASCPEDAVRVAKLHTVDGMLPETDRLACLRCGVCVEVCPTGARVFAGELREARELVAEVARDAAFFEASQGGVTFSGGEPLMQPGFLLQCLRECRRLGIHSAVDTSGMAPRGVLLEVAAATDLILFDIKDVDPERHLRNTGAPLPLILENLRAVDRAEAELWIRVPVIPGVHDTAQAQEAYVRLLGSLHRRHQVWLLPYHDTAGEKYRRLGQTYPSIAEVPERTERPTAFASALRAAGFEVRIGGEARA